MNRAWVTATVLLVATAFPTASRAANWHADGKSSSLAFTGVSQGSAFQGRFGAFDADIDFDPAHPASGRFFVTVQLGSASTANADRDTTLRGKDFFDVAGHPTATWSASKIRALGGNRYAADGTLTLRGVTKPVTLSFTWTPGAQPGLSGDATVNRLDFNVGGGDWADTSQIGNAVKVHSVLKLAPGKR